MKEKKKLNQNTFLLLVTILLFFVMYAIGCVLFNAQGFAKTQNFLNLFISNAGLIVIGIGNPKSNTCGLYATLRLS